MSKYSFPILACLATAFGSVACSGSNSATGSDTPAVEPVELCVQQSPHAQNFEANMQAVGDAGTNGLTMHLETASPSPPVVGDNVWTLSLADGSGPLTGATITLVQQMPAMGHGGVRTAKMTDNGDGTYAMNPVNFNMPGYWTNTFTVVKTSAGIDNVFGINICVE